MIDPYHKWLGIPKDQRPPTFYQLLGISPKETDPEVIQEGALRQTSHVRTYQTGPYAEECTRLLNEIAQARTVLLDPAGRAAYDAGLSNTAREAATPSDEKKQPADFEIVPQPPPRAIPSSQAAPRLSMPPRSWWAEPWLWAYALLLVLGGAGAFFLTSRNYFHGPEPKTKPAAFKPGKVIHEGAAP